MDKKTANKKKKKKEEESEESDDDSDEDAKKKKKKKKKKKESDDESDEESPKKRYVRTGCVRGADVDLASCCTYASLKAVVRTPYVPRTYPIRTHILVLHSLRMYIRGT